MTAEQSTRLSEGTISVTEFQAAWPNGNRLGFPMNEQEAREEVARLNQKYMRVADTFRLFKITTVTTIEEIPYES